MEKILYALVLILMFPIALFAGEREFDETKYVFQSLNPKPLEDPDERHDTNTLELDFNCRTGVDMGGDFHGRRHRT